MSIWTHVNCAMRLDGFFTQGHNATKSMDFWYKFTGKPITWDDIVDNTDDAETRLPMGSEGSLRVGYVYTGKQTKSSMTSNVGTLLIYGDLRDYDDEDAVLNYINQLIIRLEPMFFLRSGILEIHVETDKSAKVYVYDRDYFAKYKSLRGLVR